MSTAASRAKDYITAFTVYLDTSFQAHVDLVPTLREGFTVQRAATPHDFDVAALWVAKQKKV